MKRIKYIALATLIAGMSSCSHGWLDVEPSTSVETETSIKSLREIEFTLNGTYNLMHNSDTYSGRLMFYADVTGDDMQAVDVTKRTARYYRFDFNKDSNPSTHWAYLYKIINNCNTVINQIGDIQILEKEYALRDDLLGQAYAIRGLAYFDLVRLFGYPYKKDSGASLGVPIILEHLSHDAKPKRATVAECYTQFIDDLKKGCDLMNDKFKKGKMTRWAAMTLLSRAYLYKGEDALALQTAEEAIKGAEKARYKLWLNEDYASVWGVESSDKAPGEVLFEIVNETTESPGKESMGYLNHYDGYADMCITASFYNLLKQDPDDARLDVLTFYKSKSGARMAFINKFQPQENEAIEDGNIPLVRLSETYLIAAEAAVKVGDNDKAVKYLDPIVNRANPEKTVVGETITVDRVKLERRKELFGEGHRMYDAVRDGGTLTRKDEKVSDKKINVEHFELLDGPYGWDYYKIVLPIPTREKKANPNMEQNPGYGD